MPRQDGRIEQGQRLASAISARAWNRSQDAADIVLGSQYGLQANAPSNWPVKTMVVTISNGDYTASLSALPDASVFGVGSALDLNPSSVTLGTLVDPDDVQSGVVANESNLPKLAFSARHARLTELSFGTGDSFGIVLSISPPDGVSSNDYTITLGISGVFSCIVYAFGINSRACGAYPIPLDDNEYPKALWRPYPVMSPAGAGAILGLGAYHKLDAQSQWPRLYEAVIRL